MALMEARNICVRLGGRQILRGVDICLEAGQKYALMGLNGSGKTTLLRVLCGLIPLQGGEASIGGKMYLHMGERERAALIAWIPQRASRALEAAALEAVLMGSNARLGLLSSPGKAEKHRAMEALRQVGMEGSAQENFAVLSEGQKQLVLLARAMAQDAPVWLLDEADSSLDFLNRHRILALLDRQAREHGKAILMAVHDPNYAMNWADRIFLLQDGRILTGLRPKEMSRAEMQLALNLVYPGLQLEGEIGRWFARMQE